MVAMPDLVGVHENTRSGDVPLLPQLPASALAPLVVPLTLPPAGGMTVGVPQLPPPPPPPPPPPAGGVTLREYDPARPRKPSTTIATGCPAVTVGVTREPRDVPPAIAQASSLQAISVPVQEPFRTYRTVSKLVPVPQVWIVAVPDVGGVQR